MGFQDFEDLYALKQWTYSHPLHCLYNNILSKGMVTLMVIRINNYFSPKVVEAVKDRGVKKKSSSSRQRFACALLW